MKKPAKRASRRRNLPCDKWIVGMVDPQGRISMFTNPRVYTSYDAAATEAEVRCMRHGKPFVVFGKRCVIGPSQPPIVKTEFIDG